MQVAEPVEEVSVSKQVTENGRGKRVTKPPIWLKDYVTAKAKSAKCSYSIANYVEYDHLSTCYQEYLSLFSTSI